MTSEEIKGLDEWHKTSTDDERAHELCHWLKEIAYQLAVMNEQKLIELQRQSEVLNS